MELFFIFLYRTIQNYVSEKFTPKFIIQWNFALEKAEAVNKSDSNLFQSGIELSPTYREHGNAFQPNRNIIYKDVDLLYPPLQNL